MSDAARATPFALPLRRPLTVAGAVVPARFGVLIERDGGLGEATALPQAPRPDAPSAAAVAAALECAALDRAARAAGRRLADHLGGARRRAIAVNALLASLDPAAAADEALALVARGFRCLKLKLSPRDLAGDRRRLAAVRAAVGPAVALRGDANAAWSVDYALAALRALAEFDLEYVEQPVPSVAELAAVRRAAPVPIAADESVVDADSVDALIAAGAADVVVLKPALLGAQTSLDAARRAQAAGLAVTVTSALDSSIGIAFAAHVAAAIAGPLRACGLATAELLGGDLVREPLAIADGELALPNGSGLGVELDTHAVARFRTATSYSLPNAAKTAHAVAAGLVPAGDAKRRQPPSGAASEAWLDHRARTHGDRLALSDGTTTLTFAALRDRAAAVGAALARHGIGRGDRIALLLADRLAFAVWLHGITRHGAVAVPLGDRLGGADLERQLRICRCRALVSEPTTAALAAAIPDALAGTRLDAADTAGGAPPPASLDLAAPHSVVFTSGSSGMPKAVVLTAGNHFWNAVGSALALGVADDDRWLACLPLHHVGGLAILVRGVVSGVPVLLQPRFDPGAVNDAIDRDGVTRVSLVPTMLQRVLDARGERPFPPTLRTVLLGGAAAPRAVLDACARRGVPLAATYGMTEAASQIATNGRPLLGVAVRLMRDGAPVAAGEIGAIEVAGPTISPGHLVEGDRLEPTGTWLRTRDLGRLEADGRLAVVGRADDVIITGGENVHPREVEEALERHPAVAEACVFGLPDPLWGEIVAAWVRPCAAAALDADALAAHARAHLAGFKIPRRLRVVADFPRSAAGKILRADVRAAAAAVATTDDAPATPRRADPAP